MINEENKIAAESNGKKRDSCCKISNETVAGIEISFKEKDIKYLEFLFVYYMDDPICKDHDWELFDRLSPRKGRNRINLNSGQLFEILVKDWICAKRLKRYKANLNVENITKKIEKFHLFSDLSQTFTNVSPFYRFKSNVYKRFETNPNITTFWQYKSNVFKRYETNPNEKNPNISPF